MSKRLLKLSTLEESRARDWSVRPKCKSIRKNWRQGDLRERPRLPDTNLTRKLSMHP